MAEAFRNRIYQSSLLMDDRRVILLSTVAGAAVLTASSCILSLSGDKMSDTMKMCVIVSAGVHVDYGIGKSFERPNCVAFCLIVRLLWTDLAPESHTLTLLRPYFLSFNICS